MRVAARGSGEDFRLPCVSDCDLGPWLALLALRHPDQFLPQEQAEPGGARNGGVPARGGHPSTVFCLRFHPRQLESIGNARSRIYVLVRRCDRLSLRYFCIRPGHLCRAPHCGPSADDLIPFRRQRAERPDIGAWPAACDVRPDQCGVEHLPVDPDGGGPPHRRQPQQHARTRDHQWSRSYPLSRRRCHHGGGRSLRGVEAEKRLRQHRQRTGRYPATDRRSQTAGGHCRSTRRC